ncbi:MAG: hypothetical protein IJJ33_02255 [Victivallales bacterium]|nr:hypothetical protein [Victivallales bacterium]
MRRVLLNIGGSLLLVMLAGMAQGQAQAQEKSPEVQAKEDKLLHQMTGGDEARIQLAKMRGRLLVKKNQVRKLEKEACAANPELKAKVTELDKERRTLFVAAEPKLQGVYAEVDTLEKEIEKLANSRK